MTQNALDAINALFFDAFGDQQPAALVQTAYEGLLGYDIGDVTADRQNYWVDRLESGALAAEDFAASFIAAARDDQGTNVSDNDHAANQAVIEAHLAALEDDPDATLDDLIAVAARARTDFLEGSPPGNDNDPPGVPGDTLSLTTGHDNLVGTQDDDSFFATPQAANGAIANTLNTGDILDGAGGSNRLEAAVISDTTIGGAATPIRPITSNIDTVEINALLQAVDEDDDRFFFISESGNGPGSGTVTLNAEAMSGVTEWASTYSQGDVVLQNLTTTGVTEDVTIRMDHTGNRDGQWGESNFTALFNQNHLLSGEQVDDARILFNVMNQDAYDAGQVNNFSQPLISVTFDTFRFTIAGEEYDLTDVDGDNLLGEAGDDTGSVIATYSDLETAVNTALDELRDRFPDRDELAEASAFLEGTFEDPDGRVGESLIIAVPGDIDIGFPTANPNNSVFLRQANENADVDGVEVESSNRFDNAVEAPEPEFADLPVTATIALEKVGQGSDGGYLVVGGMSSSSTSRDVEVFNVTVQGDASKPSNLAGLRTKKSDSDTSLATLNIATADADSDDPAALTLGNGNTGSAGPFHAGLATFNAGDLLGDLNLNGVRTDGGRFTLGQADNSADLTVTSGALNTVGTRLDVTAHAGDDDITIAINGNNGSAGRNISVDAGDGDNRITLNGEGSARADTGSGDDVIVIDNSGTTGETALVGIEDEYQLFGVSLQLTYKGVASDVIAIDYDSSAYTTSYAQIFEAVEAAVASRPALDEMVVVRMGATGEIVFDSLIDGGGNEGTLEFFGPRLSGDDSRPDLQTVTANNLDNAAAAWFPASDGVPSDGGLSSSADDLARDPLNIYSSGDDTEDMVEAMQDYLDTNVNPGLANINPGGSDAGNATTHVINAGSGEDVIWLSSNDDAVDTVAFNGNFDSAYVMHFLATGDNGSPGDDDRLDFTAYLDADAHGRGSSVDADERVEDSVQYSLENELDGGSFTGDHNSIGILGFEDMWNALDEDDADKPASFEDFSASNLADALNEDRNADGDGFDDADSEGMDYVILLARDALVTLDEDGDPDGVDSITAPNEFHVFTGTTTYDEDDDVLLFTGLQLHGLVNLGQTDLADLGDDNFVGIA